MGIFSKLFGSSSKESTKSDPFAEIAKGLLFDELNPGLGQDIVDADIGGTKAFKRLVNRTPGILEGGLGGTGTDPNATGGANLFDQRGSFDTVFEKGDTAIFEDVLDEEGNVIPGERGDFISGELGEAGQSVFDTAINQVQAVNLAGVNLGTQLSTQALNVQIPDLPSVKDVGTLTSEIIQNLPPEMQAFITNIFKDSSPEAIAAELDNLAQAILTDAKSNATGIGQAIMGQFGAEGLGSSGAAMKALQTMGVQVAINANAKIAEARLAGLNTLIQARNQGVTLVETLTTLGRSEQASRVTENIAQLESQTRIATAQIQASVALQTALADVSARLQLGQLVYNATIFGSLVNQSTLQENAAIGGAQSQIDTLLALSTGQTQQRTGADPGAISRVAEGVGNVLNIGKAITGLF